MLEANKVGSPNNSSDFQPTTQNPQSIGQSGLQTPATGLQTTPSDSLSGTELLQQAEQTSGLSVETGTSTVGSISPSSHIPEVARADAQALIVVIILGIALLAAVAYVWKNLLNKGSTDTAESLFPTVVPVTESTAESEKTAVSANKSKKKAASRAKKRTSKKKKG